MKPRRYVCGDCGSDNIDWARCSLDNCDRLVFSRGWCKKHYQRWYKYGDPLVDLRKPVDTLLADDGFWDKVDETTQSRVLARSGQSQRSGGNL